MIASSGAGWERPFLRRLASLQLLSRAYDQIDALPAEPGKGAMEGPTTPAPAVRIASGTP